MAYAESYNASDASTVVIDLVGTIGVALVGFATLIGLALLYRWFKKRVPKL